MISSAVAFRFDSSNDAITGGSNKVSIPTQLANLSCCSTNGSRPGRRRSSLQRRHQQQQLPLLSSMMGDVELTNDYELGLKDVVCSSKRAAPGRRRSSSLSTNNNNNNSHSGNLRLRVLVELQLSRYYQQDCNIIQQSKLVKSVVDSVQESGGSFVKYCNDGSWWQVSRAEAIKYTTSLFRNFSSRDCEATFFSSLSSGSFSSLLANKQSSSSKTTRLLTSSGSNNNRVGHVLLVVRNNSYRPNYENLFSQMASSIARA